MQFFHPLNLLWALPIGGIIITLYILKLRRKDVVVSSDFLWRQVIRDVQANAPFQKLRKNLLLLLQLIAAALLIFALSRPFFRYTTIGGRNVILVIDGSASMGATDVPGSRLAAAKRRAHELIGQRKPGDLMMILLAAQRPQTLTGFTRDAGELSRAIDSITLHHTPSNMRESLSLAADLVSSQTNDNGVIELISDGGFEDEEGGSPASASNSSLNLGSLNLGKTHLRFHPIGVRQNNVGIVSVDFRPNLGKEKTVQLLVVTKNFTKETKKFSQEIRAENRLVEANEIELKPGAEDVTPYDIPEPANPIRMQVKLDIKDDLEIDNAASLVLKPRKQIKVLLVGEENIFLQNALTVDPTITLSKTAGFTSGAGFDVVIFNGSAPAKLPDGNYLFLHCVSDQTPVRVEGSTEGVVPADWEKTHPVMRYQDFSGLRFGSVMKATAQGWGEELAVADSGALIVVGERGKSRTVFVAFDLNYSNFPLRVGFPIFMSNATRWLAVGSNSGEQGLVQTGNILAIPAPTGLSNITITRPDGSKRQLRVGERGGAVFDEADLIGHYTAEGQNFNFPFAANLASMTESNTTPKQTVVVANNPMPMPNRKIPANWEFLPIAILVALGLLAFEWWAFHRRAFIN